MHAQRFAAQQARSHRSPNGHGSTTGVRCLHSAADPTSWNRHRDDISGMHPVRLQPGSNVNGCRPILRCVLRNRSRRHLTAADRCHIHGSGGRRVLRAFRHRRCATRHHRQRGERAPSGYLQLGSPPPTAPHPHRSPAHGDGMASRVSLDAAARTCPGASHIAPRVADLTGSDAARGRRSRYRPWPTLLHPGWRGCRAIQR